MATVRMTLAAAGLMVFGVCGMAFAGGPAGAAAAPSAPAAVSSKDQSEVSGTGKPKAADSVSMKKIAKTVAGPKAGGKAAGAKSAKRAPGSGRMQVEEPKAAAPANSARESKAWQKSHARGLTAAQKQAFRERKESMEGMIAVIKEKRKALRDAKPEERAALTRELHSLILEKDPQKDPPDNSSASSASAATARVGKPAPDKPVPDAKNSGQTSQRDSQRDGAKKAEAAEERRRRIEAQLEQLRKKEEIRKQQLEKYKSGLESSLAPHGGLSHGIEED